MTEIPQMTHELDWRQPDRSDILLDDRHALMSRATFDKLAEYSTSIPIGVYDGKMWKAQVQRANGFRWLLRWYDRADSPAHCSLKSREIIFA